MRHFVQTVTTTNIAKTNDIRIYDNNSKVIVPEKQYNHFKGTK